MSNQAKTIEEIRHDMIAEYSPNPNPDLPYELWGINADLVEPLGEVSEAELDERLFMAADTVLNLIDYDAHPDHVKALNDVLIILESACERRTTNV